MVKHVFNINDYVKSEFNKPVRIDINCNVGHVQSYLHWHPHYEIQIIFSGVYAIENSNTKIESSKPGVFIHAPYSLHRTNASREAVYRRNILSIKRDILTLVTPSILDMSVFDGVNLAYAFPNPAMMSEFRDISLMMNNYDNDRAYLALYTALIMKKMIDLINSGAGKFIKSSVTYMQDVLRYIGSNLASTITLGSLSEQYEISKSKLNLDFRTATGTTFKQYITNLRMTKARELLASGSSIINASLETGYSSEAHFIAAFKAYWGMTPGNFINGISDYSV